MQRPDGGSLKGGWLRVDVDVGQAGSLLTRTRRRPWLQAPWPPEARAGHAGSRPCWPALAMAARRRACAGRGRARCEETQSYESEAQRCAARRQGRGQGPARKGRALHNAPRPWGAGRGTRSAGASPATRDAHHGSRTPRLRLGERRGWPARPATTLSAPQGSSSSIRLPAVESRGQRQRNGPLTPALLPRALLPAACRRSWRPGHWH